MLQQKLQTVKVTPERKEKFPQNELNREIFRPLSVLTESENTSFIFNSTNQGHVYVQFKKK